MVKRFYGKIPEGWHGDEDVGGYVREVIHRTWRRCRNWDYRGCGAYLITITLADRGSCALGRLAHSAARGAYVELSGIGRMVEGAIRELPAQWPGVAVLGSQIMPDHVHFVLAVRIRQRKPLGAIVGSFKSKATSRWLDMLGRTRPGAMGGLGSARPGATGGLGVARPQIGRVRVSCALARAPKLWSDGFVENILFDEGAVANALAYLADNPRRLWEKRAHPDLFAVLRDLPIPLGPEFGVGHFAAIGNHHLLRTHSLVQVQCSRRSFAYARDDAGQIVKDAPPRIASSEFRERCEALLLAAAKGATLVSPCISEGEREIAHRAFVAGYRVIMLANMGFSPLYKPGGKLFDTCKNGNLLMLAPIAWPYLPGEKKITRFDACVLNFLAQRIAGSGATEIRYNGFVPEEIVELAKAAVSMR